MILRAAAITCCALLAATAYGAAVDYDELFQEALRSVDFEFDRNWAYTETSVDDEHVWVGRFDPRRPAGERWQLLSIDKRTPTPEEIDEYLDNKDDDFSDDDVNEIVEMVEPDSVRLIEETVDYWLLAFNLDEDEEAITESVEATIRVSKQGRYLEYVDVHNTEVVRPAFGVKLTKLITRLTFGPAAEDGPIVPLSTQVEVIGQAFVFFSFDEQELSRNSDFEYTGGD